MREDYIIRHTGTNSGVSTADMPSHPRPALLRMTYWSFALWRQVDLTRAEALKAQRGTVLSNEFAQVARGSNKSQQIPNLRKADWYKVVQDKIARMAMQSRSAFRLKEGGSCNAAEWFRNAARTSDPDILASIRRTRPLHAHFATLIMTGVVQGQI